MKKTTPKAGIKPTAKHPEDTTLALKMIKKTPKNEKVVNQKENDKAKLISFSIKATIPTQQYGNLMPEIVVSAPSIEAARDTVMPIMEEIYKKYAEPAGRNSYFYVKPEVVSQERVISMPVAAQENKVAMNMNTIVVKNHEVESAKEVLTPKEESKVNTDISTQGPEVKSEAYSKAENAIVAAQSIEALNLVEDKIKASTKIENADKPFLYTLILKKKAIKK